jgi:hypothetical protein
MCKLDEFRLVQIQPVIITSDPKFQGGRALSHFLRHWGEVFQGEPFAAEFPKDTPPELPRIVLQSEDGEKKLLAGPLRIDLVCARPIERGFESLAGQTNWASEIFTKYVRELQPKVVRLACVVTRALPKSDPGQTLAQHFCQEKWLREPFNRLSNFEIHGHKRFSLTPRFPVNSWVKCRTSPSLLSDTAKNSPPDTIVVEQDINTFHEREAQSGQFNTDSIAEFFGIIPEWMDRIARLYFPGE